MDKDNILDRFGLSSFQLKILGLIFMVIDHIYQMFHMFGVPSWFNMIGRMAAPIFLFLVAEGLYYTKDRKKYLTRLLLGYWVMGLLSFLIQKFFALDGVSLGNNMFGTLFLSGVYIWAIDFISGKYREKNYKAVFLGVFAMLIPYLLGFVNLFFFSYNRNIFSIMHMLIPTPFFVEGGFDFIILACTFYMLKNNRVLRVIPLLIVSLLHFRSSTGSYQWIMGFAAIFLLLYNGEEGKKSKYFFYLFYPLHIYVLYFISFIMNKLL